MCDYKCDNGFIAARPRVTDGPVDFVSYQIFGDHAQLEVECVRCEKVWFAQFYLPENPMLPNDEYTRVDDALAGTWLLKLPKTGHTYSDCIEHIRDLALGRAQAATQPVEVADW